MEYGKIEVKPLYNKATAAVKVETGNCVPETQRTVDKTLITGELRELIRRVNVETNIFQMTYAKYEATGGEFFIIKILRK